MSSRCWPTWPRHRDGCSTREQLLDALWPSGGERNSGTVTEHVGRLRRRIEDDPDRPRWIHTVRGVGYRFEP